MSASSGKVALVQDSDALAGVCPRGELIVDFVGCMVQSRGRPRSEDQQHPSLDVFEVGWGRAGGDNQADFVTAPPLLMEQ